MLLAIVMHACSSNQTSNLPPATSISACMLIQSDFKFTTSNICFITGIPTLRVIAGGQTLIECPMHQTFELLNCYTTRAMEQQTLISSQKAELWHGCGVSGVHGDLYGSALHLEERTGLMGRRNYFYPLHAFFIHNFPVQVIKVFSLFCSMRGSIINPINRNRIMNTFTAVFLSFRVSSI